MNKLTDSFVLNNGYKIPCVGYGTWQTPDGETAVNSVKCALERGYRHIDTAAVYGNEASVGEGIRRSGIAREEIFITSKVWNTERGYEKTLKAFDQTMEDLGLDYLDLYLIHWPQKRIAGSDDWKKINQETWRALETLYKQGRVKAIGVSNFFEHHIEAILETCEIAPMVNQIEFHPGLLRPELRKYCADHNILVEAWSPLGTGRMLNNPNLMEIAAKYDRSVAQLCIRWAMQHDVLPLPKSITPARIEQNTHVFDFEISDADMQTIDAMPYCGGSGLDPDTFEP